MIGIHAELDSADVGRHQRIVLMAAGADPSDTWATAEAAKHLQLLTPLFSKTDPPGALTCPATWPAVVQLSATFGEAFVPGPALCEWIERQVAARSDRPPMKYAAPDGLTPYVWQTEGAEIIAALPTAAGALVTDEPGTGKTITAILGLAERWVRYWQAPRPGKPGALPTVEPIVVVCPASVVDAWVKAFRDWAPHWRTVAWRGVPVKRHALAGTADVYVVSYDTARRDAPKLEYPDKPLLDLAPAALVIDECHMIKNAAIGRTKAVKRLAKTTDCVIALSGTPITHHPGDLTPTLDVLVPGAFPAGERFVNRYCVVVSGDYDTVNLGLDPVREPEFRLSLLGQHRRVAKADVLTELPPKVYSIRTVDLPARWRKAYADFEARMIAELPEDGGELSVMDVMSKFTHLSALSSAAADVEVTYGPDVDKDGELKRHVHLELKAPSWKVDALLEVLEERPESAVGVFAPSRQLIMLAGAAAAAVGRRVGYVVGGQSMTERTRTVDAFQAGELDLICCTTGAGGVGLTLTAASTCVFLQRPWSLVESIQAEDRFHRIGSERHESIEIIDVVARNTIDTRVRAVLRERAGQLADLVQDPRIVAELLGGQSLRRAS